MGGRHKIMDVPPSVPNEVDAVEGCYGVAARLQYSERAGFADMVHGHDKFLRSYGQVRGAANDAYLFFGHHIVGQVSLFRDLKGALDGDVNMPSPLQQFLLF